MVIRKRKIFLGAQKVMTVGTMAITLTTSATEVTMAIASTIVDIDIHIHGGHLFSAKTTHKYIHINVLHPRYLTKIG